MTRHRLSLPASVGKQYTLYVIRRNMPPIQLRIAGQHTTPFPKDQSRLKSFYEYPARVPSLGTGGGGCAGEPCAWWPSSSTSPSCAAPSPRPILPKGGIATTQLPSSSYWSSPSSVATSTSLTSLPTCTAPPTGVINTAFWPASAMSASPRRPISPTSSSAVALSSTSSSTPSWRSYGRPVSSVGRL
jgi:hypothetical protein